MGKLRLAFLAVLVLPTTLGSTQEQTLTVRQCRVFADALGEGRNADGLVRHAQNLSFREVQREAKELVECASVDSARSNLYYTGTSLYLMNEVDRLSHFIDRHQLRAQFIVEDDAGER
jgi:hypothetical protein